MKISNKLDKKEIIRRSLEIRKRGKSPVKMGIVMVKLGEDEYLYKDKKINAAEARRILGKFESIFGMKNIVIEPHKKQTDGKSIE